MAYLKSRLPAILACVLVAAVFQIILLLYGLPFAALIYPTVLCLLLGALALGADYAQIQSRRRKLQRALGLTYSLISDALPQPKSPLDEDYTALIHALCDLCRTQSETAERQGREQADYYTVWAHQIKTPIASMRLRLQNEDSAQSRALSSELVRIEQYVEMVLAYQRLDSDSTDYVFRHVRLDDVLRQVLKRLAGSFILRGLKLSFTPTNMEVLTDEKWLSFVLEQLLSNALKYTPSGCVTISAEQGNILFIRDTGIGIAPEDLPRVFERGYTGANGRTDTRATGIGLYLCKRICHNLNHGLILKSAPGRGTTARLDFSRSETRIE